MKNNVRENYDLLAARLEEIGHIGSVLGILHWDQEVIMPEGGAASRARQLATMAGVNHERQTDPEIGTLLGCLEKCPEAQFNDYEWGNIREARREYDRETRVPKTLVQEIAEVSSRGHQTWIRAREENRYEDFAPLLKKLVTLKIEWAGHINPDLPPYDVNIDQYERGVTMDQVDPLFDRLKTELIPLIRSVQESPCQPDASLLQGTFPIDRQEALARRISAEIGFDFNRGRMDVSVHPFCGGGDPTDVRITTRYRENNFVESLYAVIHETGHALYEQGRMPEYRSLPVSEALSMGIHESQSLFWERMIAQNENFCAHYLGLFREMFPEQFDGVNSRALYEAINRCEPSLIRVEADEVTYPLHVVLRYELEKGLFDGSISVDQLPEIWNQKMEEYLGIRPPDNAQGVLQDVHWSLGYFGYFPSYTLGALYAAQFFNAMKRDLPDAETLIAEGRFQPIREWLNRNIHSQGRLYSVDGLVRKVTGEPLNPDHFLNHIQQKYREIYRLAISD